MPAIIDTTPPPAIHCAASIDYNRLIACLIAVENTPWDKPGGGLQFIPATWKQFAGKLPYRMACNRPQAIIIAKLALDDYSVRRESEGHIVTVEFLAQCWRSGYGGSRLLYANGAHPIYATRVANLYRDKSFHP